MLALKELLKLLLILNFYFINCSSNAESFKLEFFTPGGHEIKYQYNQKNLWIRLTSNATRYWLYLKKQDVKRFPLLIKSQNNVTMVNIEPKNICLYTASSKLIKWSTENQKDINRRYRLKSEFQIANKIASEANANTTRFSSISLCDGVYGIVSVYNSSVRVKLESFNHRFVNLTFLPSAKLLNVNSTIQKNDYLTHESMEMMLKRAKRSIHMPIHSKYSGPYLVELYVFIDKYLIAYWNNEETVLQRIIFYINQANMAFSEFNIYFAIVGMETWTYDIVDLNTADNALDSLAIYKRRYIEQKHDCFLAFLARSRNAKESGSAKMEKMCSFSFCASFVKDSSEDNQLVVAHSVVHELGHTFGLRHDTELCNCVECIMATGTVIRNKRFQWSSCSKHDIRSLLKMGMSDCLKDYPVKQDKSRFRYPHSYKEIAFDQSQLASCGNGVVDEGEDCDCGDRDHCTEEFLKCCNPDTCRFKGSAQCASGACCNLNTCTLKVKTSICRFDKINDCDLPEYCDGISEWCPNNVYKIDGVPCITDTNENSYCYHGQCKTRQTQCNLLWGVSSKVSCPGCFGLNKQSSKIRNCGIDNPTKDEMEYLPDNWRTVGCKDQDTMCGRLWCDQSNERLLRLSATHEEHVTVGYCYCSAVRFPIDWFGDDAGMVPNMTPCGYNKVCYKGKCRDYGSVVTSSCKCNGAGVCNNLGNCHCNNGYAPPNCTNDGGYGGSVDSGPPSQHMMKMKLTLGYAFLFLILFLISFIVIVIHRRYRDKRWPSMINKILDLMKKSGESESKGSFKQFVKKKDDNDELKFVKSPTKMSNNRFNNPFPSIYSPQQSLQRNRMPPPIPPNTLKLLSVKERTKMFDRGVSYETPLVPNGTLSPKSPLSPSNRFPQTVLVPPVKFKKPILGRLSHTVDEDIGNSVLGEKACSMSDLIGTMQRPTRVAPVLPPSSSKSPTQASNFFPQRSHPPPPKPQTTVTKHQPSSPPFLKPNSSKPVSPKPTSSKPSFPKPTPPKPTLPKPTPPKLTPSKPTSPKPTLPKPTPPKPTSSKPTPPKPTSPKPTPPKPTSSKPTLPKQSFSKPSSVNTKSSDSNIQLSKTAVNSPNLITAPLKPPVLHSKPASQISHQKPTLPTSRLKPGLPESPPVPDLGLLKANLKPTVNRENKNQFSTSSDTKPSSPPPPPISIKPKLKGQRPEISQPNLQKTTCTDDTVNLPRMDSTSTTRSGAPYKLKHVINPPHKKL